MSNGEQSCATRIMRAIVLVFLATALCKEAPLTFLCAFATFCMIPERSITQFVRWFNGELEKGLDRDDR